MKPSILTLLFLSFFCQFEMFAQATSGQWTGFVVQEVGQDSFSYQIDWERNGEAISGTSLSKSMDGKTEARFTIAGRWDGSRIRLQEVQQLSPASPEWCLKTINLRLRSGSNNRYQGDWSADGCRPGLIFLTDPAGKVDRIAAKGALAGHWVGYLEQSDREYGFYFTVDLADDGTGVSYIISEGEGGEAWHNLTWKKYGNRIAITEKSIKEKTDPEWPWCIKSLDLSLERGYRKDVLTGQWRGYLENSSPNEGGCAPGTVLLEQIRPIVEKELEEEKVSISKIESARYEQKEGRKVKIDRVIELAPNAPIRIRVWDNGTVDGDEVTIFLNGKRILHNYRVSKRKWSETIQLEEGENLLILHAEDLGDIKPNTVAVSLDDGQKEQIIILTSNLYESGAILMQPFRYKN